MSITSVQGSQVVELKADSHSVNMQHDASATRAFPPRREFVLFMMVTDETSSVLYPDNLRRFLPNLVTNTTVLIPPSPNEETGVSCCCFAAPVGLT